MKVGESCRVSKRKPNTERFIHTYYCFRVDNYLQSQGYSPIREYGPKNEPIFSQTSEDGKLINILKRIDVYAEIDGCRIGYEITNSFSNLYTNIFKCLGLMKMDQVVIICENQNRVKEAKEIIEKKKIPEYQKEKIKFIQICEFL